MAGKLEGRRILVTGAASGMGRAIAELFASEGAKLGLLDRNEAGAAEVAGRLGAVSYACDVSNLVQVEQVVRTAAGALGGLDGLVNAAGVHFQKPFMEITPEENATMIGVNLMGPYNLTRAALPFLQQAEKATIVNIASVSGYMPMMGTSCYSATKGGVIMLTKCLGLELGPKIRVNAICPGAIRTEMTRYIWTNPEHLKLAGDRVALKRMGEPDDIAKAALFLSTEESSYSTGTEITVDGGFSWR